MEEPLDLGGFDLGAALGIPEPEPEPEQPKPDKSKPGEIKIAHRMSKRPLDRKALSEKTLESAIQRWSFREGDAYHCLTFGDVDFITFVKFIVRQQYCPYIAISSWVVSGEDILDLQEWHRRGLVGRIDFYLGDNVRDRHPEAYRMIKELLPSCGGRLAVFPNHTKIIAIQGDRFDALIESSANMNERLIPHFEQTCITVNTDLVRHTIDTLAEIRPANKETFSPPYRMEMSANG